MSLASRGSSHGPLRGVGSAGRDVLRLALGHEQRVLHRRRPGHDPDRRKQGGDRDLMGDGRHRVAPAGNLRLHHQRLERLTITNFYYSQDGVAAAAYAKDLLRIDDCVIANCTFSGNGAKSEGSGICGNVGATLVGTNCSSRKTPAARA